MRGQGWGALAVAATLLASCSQEDAAPQDTDGTADTEIDATELPEGHARLVHTFGTYALAPREEVEPCIQWTLDNEEAVYVNRIDLINNGGFHHSNWLVVPEDYAPGPDGFFDCGERGFTELQAALQGTVLFAQSTQSRVDGVEFPEGTVVKVPPRHKLLAGGHLLNLSDTEYETELRMTLEIVHPREVDVVLTPFRLSYLDLDIPARSESRFSGDCDFEAAYGPRTGSPLDLKLYYLIPHYHYLGNYFDLSISGGPQDGQSIYTLNGFNADNNGQVFDPPIDLTGARGLKFTCGYDNWRDKSVGWGIGDQEMCVMLGMADSKVIMEATVIDGNVVDVDGGMKMNAGNCKVLTVSKQASQAMPTPEELAAPLYVPPTDPEDQGLPPFATCEDTPASATPREEPTLSNISKSLFVSSCTYSSCHHSGTAVAGLDLQADDLHAELLKHDVTANTDLPLVTPGDPERSYLYKLIAECDPTDKHGNTVRRMPLNAAFLSDPSLVAMVRDWITAGAPNN